MRNKLGIYLKKYEDKWISTVEQILTCRVTSSSMHFKFFIYLAALGVRCSTQDLWSPLQRSESSICSSENVQLQHAGSLLVACGTQFLDQGSNLDPLHWDCEVWAIGLKGSLKNLIFKWPLKNMIFGNWQTTFTKNT